MDLGQSRPARPAAAFHLPGPVLVTATAPTFDATHPDISAFTAAGGKLLMWHGQADPALTIDRTIQYYNDVAKAMGNKNKIESFYRLFLPEGMHHCGGGPGLNSFDALTALEQWVEGGIAPDSLLASHVGPGVARTRPVCAHPKIAVYDGRGDISSAARYSCQERRLGWALNGRQSGAVTGLGGRPGAAGAPTRARSEPRAATSGTSRCFGVPSV